MIVMQLLSAAFAMIALVLASASTASAQPGPSRAVGPVTAAVVSATVSARNRLAQGEKVVYDLGTGGLAYSTVTSSPGGPAWW